MQPPPQPRNSAIPLLLAALLALTACGGGDTPSKEPAAEPAAPQGEAATAPLHSTNVEVLTVEPRSFSVYATYVGHLLPDERVVHSSEIEGLVEIADFEEGQAVKKGHVLVHISTNQLRVRRDLARSNLSLADTNFRRDKELRGNNLISRADLDVSANRQQVARFELQLAELELEKSVVRAAISGVIKTKGVEKGEFVQKGRLLAEILAIRNLRALIQVPEREIRNFSTGKEVQVRVDALGGSTFFGKIRKIGVEADLGSRSFPVEVQVDNRDKELKPGMLVRTRVLGGTYAQAILIPRHAVLEREEGRAVYVAEDGVARLRPIMLGESVDSDVQVVSGLGFGEQVVVQGHHRLAPGEPIVVRATLNATATGK